jgi:type II secretory pathway pseudopilin PulG
MDMELTRHSPASRRARHRRAAGFSLIEALIAAAIILIIAIGLIPLFTRAMANNVAGADSTFVSTSGQSGIERVFAIPFTNPELTMPGPAATATVPVVENFTQDPKQLGNVDSGWGGTTGLPLWTRSTTVRQYNVTSSLSDNTLDVTDAQPGSTDPTFVHLKEIEVQLTSARVGVLAGKILTLHYFRAE